MTPKQRSILLGPVEAIWRAKMGILEAWSCTGEEWALGNAS